MLHEYDGGIENTVSVPLLLLVACGVLVCVADANKARRRILGAAATARTSVDASSRSIHGGLFMRMICALAASPWGYCSGCARAPALTHAGARLRTRATRTQRSTPMWHTADACPTKKDCAAAPTSSLLGKESAHKMCACVRVRARVMCRVEG